MLDFIRRLWYMRYPTVTVYKIVRQSAYKSAVVEGKAQVKYEVGKWAIAPWWLSRKGYDLLCFDSLAAVKSFKDWYWGGSFQIWKVSAKGITASSFLPPTCWIIDLEQGKIFQDLCSWPAGTVMAKAVRLEEERID